jgi:hypothetical protein
MAQRGVHFALDSADTRKLRDAKTDDDVLSVIQDDLEERWDPRWLFQTDKGWAGIHRCLTDGALASDNGDYPLRACVLGGEHLYGGDDYLVSLLTPEQVRDVAAALAGIDRSWLRGRYDALDPAAYGAPLSDDDFDYLWSCFRGLPAFFAVAAADGRAMVFTVDL